MTALEGAAGTGKTTALATVRDAAERDGYQVEGFAPTSRATHKLAEAGIESSTLQRHLARGEDEGRPTDQKRLYVLDESSLASTKQMHTFLERLGPEDRVLLVGDVRQPEAVDAGRPYRQLQEAGIRTAHLDEIVRQRDPELKVVVEHLSRGDVQRAVEQLDHQGRVHEIGPREERLTAIANEYVKDPDATLVVSPDNQSRQDLNDVIHRTMQREGHVGCDEHRTPVLVSRQEITGADRQWAARYGEGDIVRYSRGSKTLGIGTGDYARVEQVDAKTNQVTVRTDDDRTVSYDPRRLQGVTLYRQTERPFAAGDRVQITAPDREHGVPNRELGTIERIGTKGRMETRWDSGRTSSLDAGERRHLDHGYAVTSHSSQGQTAGRVLVHVETDRASEKLVNQRLAERNPKCCRERWSCAQVRHHGIRERFRPPECVRPGTRMRAPLVAHSTGRPDSALRQSYSARSECPRPSSASALANRRVRLRLISILRQLERLNFVREYVFKRECRSP